MTNHEEHALAASLRRRQLPKAPTHIPGLDDILEGGLPRGRTTLVSGGPGSGKTLLALECLYRGAVAGEAGIFVGFEEPAEMLRQNVATLGWDLGALERGNRLFLLEGQVQPETVVSGEFSLKGLLVSIEGKRQEMGAQRIVFDPLEVVLRMLDDPHRVRAEIHAIHDWLRTAGMTAIMTIKPRANSPLGAYEEFFDSMADCVISMDARIVDQVSTRRLRVVKFRGSGFGRNEYPYVITDNGLHIAPISTVGLRHKPLGSKLSTGLKRLDSLLDGGYRRGACVLFAGSPGTGKTLLAGTFTHAACQQGEKVLYVSFEESAEALTGNMLSAGLELEPHRQSGNLVFLTSMPEAMGAEEHLIRFMVAFDTFGPDHVVVDAISACERMGGRQAAFEYLMRLLNACKDRGVTVVLVNQTTSAMDYMALSGTGISSMVDTMLSLCYVEGKGETNRMLQVLKARGSNHSNQKREYRITSNGIDILDVYLGEGEALTGTARQVQEAREEAEAQRLQTEIDAKEQEITHLKATMQTEIARQKAAVDRVEIELRQLRWLQNQLQMGREQRGKMRR